jgi:chromosomal replication initiation ATPase DnaA
LPELTPDCTIALWITSEGNTLSPAHFCKAWPAKSGPRKNFFHTFNTLFDGRKQIVLSSDRPASEIVNLEQRFVSRFECGLTTELLPQDIETRMAISPEKGPGIPIELAEDILASLAQRVRKAEALIVRSREVRRPAEPVS